MAKDHSPTNYKSFHSLCYLLFFLCFLYSISFIYYSHCSSPCSPQTTINSTPYNHSSTINLISFSSSWNHLSFSSNPPPRHLKIALFVKRWPRQNLAGGLERHALTLHLTLARRGHDVHVFTTNSSFPNSSLPYYSNAALTFHPIPPSPGGYLNQALAWKEFQIQNSSQPFDVVHTESVGLFHGRARNLTHLAVSWHGIAYETLHSDIVQDLLREPKEPRHSAFSDKLGKVVEEVKFFRNYAHHVATSDHVGDILKRVYMIPEERVHIILNGVDEEIYKPKPSSTRSSRRKFGVPESAQLVIGMAGRLVKDKGHPLMFECLKRAFMEDSRFKTSVSVLVAGDGPWASRYRDLGPNLILLGSLDQTQLSEFYNSLDIFLNPTLRAQGLDHTFIEAMLSGVPVMGTRFASITGSIIVGSEVGYTFQPTVESLKESIFKAFSDGRAVLRKKGESARNRALRLFTAKKMGAAYERLFLCISDNLYCNYPLPADREK
ncbi:hypothetical protein IEQ34_011576 [Dendrobium chrysotoxum]|uniref:Glycosyltransferase subfamily 4-like N-terminal domain-containing protein n=1 Tax=Dendrobium chrysotoxum TaxID=161865 RepID=A0AAV7GT88_DENCH|nr:hypothetical protein IEQ34_011576 [Dendrobium chrysotoxum]